jgi:hypothetical protein
LDTPKLLSEQEFEACFAHPMRDVTSEAGAVVDIWPYCDLIKLDEIGIPHLNDVHYVYRDANNHYDQVVIGTGRFNSLLVIVVDRQSRSIVGHRVLDLNREYGVTGQHLREVK